MQAVKYTDIPPVSFIITDIQMLSGGWTGHRVTAAKHIVMSQPAITRGEEELHLGLGKWNQNWSSKWVQSHNQPNVTILAASLFYSLILLFSVFRSGPGCGHWSLVIGHRNWPDMGLYCFTQLQHLQLQRQHTGVEYTDSETHLYACVVFFVLSYWFFHLDSDQFCKSNHEISI